MPAREGNPQSSIVGARASWPLFVLAALAVGMTRAIVVLRTDLQSDSYPWGHANLEVVQRDLSLRLPWALSTGVFVAALLCAAALALRTLWTHSGRRRGLFAAAVASSLVVLGLFWPQGEEPPGFIKYLLETLSPTRPQIQALVEAARVLFAVTPASMVLLAFTFTALAQRPGEDEAGEELSERLARFHALLYLAGLALVAGVLCSVLRLRLQIDPSLKGNGLDLANSLASTVSLTYGASFTVVLLGLFAPTHLVLRGRAAELARRNLPEGDAKARKDWMRERRLDDGPTMTLLRGFAVLAPLLAAVLERGLELVMI